MDFSIKAFDTKSTLGTAKSGCIAVAVFENKKLSPAAKSLDSKGAISAALKSGDISGKPGSIKSDGYLLRPGERLVIDGFRKNDREVAAFRFSSKDRAYAGNTPTGDARNVGVIGTALFEVRLDERDPDLPRRQSSDASRDDSRAFPADGGKYAPPPEYRR